MDRIVGTWIINDYIQNLNLSQDAYSAVGSASSLEVKAVAAVLPMDGFSDLFAASVVFPCSLREIAAIAAVYDPELYWGEHPKTRIKRISSVIQLADRWINENKPTERFGGNLANEDEIVRIKVRRFVAAHHAMVNQYNTVEDQNVSDCLRRILDDSHDDHDRIIGLLRSQPGLTLAQIDFVLTGGLETISEGAL